MVTLALAAQLTEKILKMPDLEIVLFMSIKVKSNCAVRLSIYDSRLVFNSNHMSTFRRLVAVVTASNTQFHPYPGVISFSKSYPLA